MRAYFGTVRVTDRRKANCTEKNCVCFPCENIATGFPDPAGVVTGWMNSDGHRANILNCAYVHMGIGYAVGGTGTVYWTQVFGAA